MQVSMMTTAGVRVFNKVSKLDSINEGYTLIWHDETTVTWVSKKEIILFTISDYDKTRIFA